MFRFNLANVVAHDVPKEDVPFVVPYQASGCFVGPDFIRDLAARAGASFAVDPPDIGLMDSMDVLAGPTYDPSKTHPLIREFYEHTSRFSLSVEPEWQPAFVPAFHLFRSLFAEKIDQFNLPAGAAEARQGMESYIETVSFDSPTIRDLRAWVRVYSQTKEAIYVGIYTTFRSGDTGYVSVGFPLPRSNVTATLVPFNINGSDFILKTRYTGTRFAGDYVTRREEDGAFDVLKLDGFEEEIQVFVVDDSLFTHHRFYLLGDNFLTLRYTMTRKAQAR
jgi:hypothetical protein